MSMSNLIFTIGVAFILAVTTRFLYLALKRPTAQSKGTTILFFMTLAGTVGGFLVGFWASITLLKVQWEDGSFIWVFIIAYALALGGFFGGVFAGTQLSRKSH